MFTLLGQVGRSLIPTLSTSTDRRIYTLYTIITSESHDVGLSGTDGTNAHGGGP